NAGDYSLHNSCSDAENDCILAIEEKFNISNVEIGDYEGFCITQFNGVDCEDYDNFILAEEDYELTNEDEEYNKTLQLIIDVNEFIETWRSENEVSYEVEGFDYWDGSNWK